MGALCDFLIIGASRCGTTSLYMWLGEHPETLLPSSGKEPCFWNYMYDFLGLDGYTKLWPGITGRALRFEASTDYLLDGHKVAERLAYWKPECKMLVMLRDPTRRAWSEYWNFWLKLYRVTPEQFLALPDQVESGYEIPTLSPLTDRSYERCVMKGLYADCLERWFEHFRKDSFFIIQSEEFFRDSWTGLRQVHDFLGLKVVMPETLRAYDPLRNPDQPIPDMPREMEEKYRAFYRPHNERLYELLGMRFDWDD